MNVGIQVKRDMLAVRIGLCLAFLSSLAFAKPNVLLILADDLGLRANPHYAHCRDLGQLGPLHLFRIESGAYQTFCAVAAADGRKLGDVKPQSLSVRTDWRTHFRQVAMCRE